MGQIIRDNSIGEALGVLAGGLTASFDPKRQWEAYALKQRVQGMEAERAKTLLESENLRRQQGAQDGLVGQFDQMFQPGRFNIPAQVEAPRPNMDFQGPGMPVANPAAQGLNDRLGFARAAARNAVMRGGGPGDALNAAYAAMAQGRVFAGGLPSTEMENRELQTALTGKIPDASTPLTERQRVMQVEEARRAKLKEAVTIPKEGGVLLSPEQGGLFGVPAGPDGTYRVDGPGPRQNGPFGGTSMDAQASNIVLQYEQARSAGLPITPEMERSYRIAKWHLTQPKVQVGADGRVVATEPTLPDFGGSPAPAPAAPAMPQPAPAPVNPATLAPLPNAGQTTDALPPPPAPAPALAPAGAQPPADMTTTRVPGATITQRAATSGHVTADASKRGGFYGRMVTGDAEIRALEAGNRLPGTFQQQLTDPRKDFPIVGSLPLGVGPVLGPTVRDEVVGENAKEHRTAAEKFITGILRDESGAVIGTPEYLSAEQMFIPTASDTPRLREIKARARQVAMEASEASLDAKSPSEMLARIKARVQEALNQPLSAPQQGGGAPQPGAAPRAVAPVQAGSPDAVRLRQSAEAAIQKIDASGLPPAEKARRRAEVQRRLNSALGGQ